MIAVVGGEGSKLNADLQLKFATRVRTCLTVTVYELPTVFYPLVHDFLRGVESREPWLVWRLLLKAVDDDLGIVGDCGSSGGGDCQGSEPNEPPERCLHAG